MRLLTTALTSALILALGVTACGDDEEEKKGSGGSGGSGTGGTAGGGTGGTAGTGGSGGTGGANQACITRAVESGTCQALAECSCSRCATELDTCYNNEFCLAIRRCAARTDCCSPVQGDACLEAGKPACLAACEPEIAAALAAVDAGATENGLGLATTLSECVYSGNGACEACPPRDGGTEGGTEEDASTD